MGSQHTTPGKTYLRFWHGGKGPQLGTTHPTPCVYLGSAPPTSYEYPHVNATPKDLS